MITPPYGRELKKVDYTPSGLVLANGCPKSGTHALMEFLEWLGLKRAPGIIKAFGNIPFAVRATPADLKPWTIEQVRKQNERGLFMHAHLSYGEWDIGNAKVITVYRDPRNVIISYLRWRGGKFTEKELIEALHHYYCDESFIDVYRSFLGWRGYSITIRYEDIPRGYIMESVYKESEQDRSTWNLEPSDWRKCWTVNIDNAFRNLGGYELLKDSGYTDY